MKKLFALLGSCLMMSAGFSCEEMQLLDLDVISYKDFENNDEQALQQLTRALHEKGIVGIRGIPGYKERVVEYIQAAKSFSALPEAVKDSYAPNRELGDTFLGYEVGKEKFKRPDGRWVIDDLKVSYYAWVPDTKENKWPLELDLKAPFEKMGELMSDVGISVMQKIGLLSQARKDMLPNRLGRMLYYRKTMQSELDNPYWCGSHFDHGMFTALLPAFYFQDGVQIAEPEEAGLFVKTTKDGIFKKVMANDPDVLLFQVGEFGQILSDDAIRATEHRVHKAKGSVERFTLALFFDAPMDEVIYSMSDLTGDLRYGGVKGAACTYRRWNDESFKRYLVTDEK